MTQLDFILGQFITHANDELEDLDLRIEAFEFPARTQNHFTFYIHDYVDHSEVKMVVPIPAMTNWLNAKTKKAQKYIMECIIKEILFDYEDKSHNLQFDEIDRIIFNYGCGNEEENLLS